MFDLGILDVAVGMALLFLAVSLICASLREAVETVMRSRAMDLERGIRELLADPRGTGFTKALFDHPLISGLFRGTYEPRHLTTTRLSWGDVRMPLAARRQLPTYIPSGQFASALLDLVVRGPGNSPYPAPPLSIEGLRSAATKLEDSQVRRAVLSAIDFGANDIQQVKANLQSWFDGTMDSVSGWYKRRTQVVLFLIGLTVAVTMNIDAITIANRLGTDAELRGAVVAAAERTVQEGSSPQQKLDVAAVRQQLTQVGLPIGWVGLWPGPQCELGAGNGEPECPKSTVGLWVHIILGWLITAFATALGAPFWFDVLNKFMVIRSTVKPKEKSPDEGSEDRAGSPPTATHLPTPSAVKAPGRGEPAAPPPAPDGYVPNEWSTQGQESEGIL